MQALSESPDTVLLYNADDPLCAMVALRVPNKSVAFGVGEDLHQQQNMVSDAQMCQRCSAMFTYEYRQYGQLGTYSCPNCGFSRPNLDFAAKHAVFGNDISFEVEEAATGAHVSLRAQRAGVYHGIRIRGHAAADCAVQRRRMFWQPGVAALELGSRAGAHCAGSPGGRLGG